LRYLLDTNVCIALINGKSPQIENRAVAELTAGATLFVSSVAVFELWYGVAKSTRRPASTAKLSAFLANWVRLLPFDEDDAAFSGDLRAAMEPIGRPIGDYDLLIAGQALRHGMTLVTANEKEFGRVPNLLWENWSRR